MPKAIILIPARYSSSRFPGKPLAKISGLSLIERVYRNCAKSGFDLAVVTDHQQIEDHVLGFSGKVVRVDDDVQSGTERIFLAYKRFFSADSKYELVINVQGDEPLLLGEDLSSLVKFHLNSSFDITTLVKERSCNDPDYSNPNVVKAVYLPKTGACPYFSRAMVPFDREKSGGVWHQHIGVYSYRPNSLQAFCASEATQLEEMERLEQLRALELGLAIGAQTVDKTLIGVDTPEDIERVEGLIRE